MPIDYSHRLHPSRRERTQNESIHTVFLYYHRPISVASRFFLTFLNKSHTTIYLTVSTMQMKTIYRLRIEYGIEEEKKEIDNDMRLQCIFRANKNLQMQILVH